MNENKKLNTLEKIALLSGLLLFSAFTYNAREKDIHVEVVPPVTEQVVSIGEPMRPVKAQTKDEPIKQRIKKEAKKPSLQFNEKISDTLPPKKETVMKDSGAQLKQHDAEAGIKKPVPLSKVKEVPKTESEKKLQEIIAIKEQIGSKKESIGKKKAKLANPEEKNDVEILQEIQEERKRIEVSRKELNKKRAQYEILKKQDERNKRKDPLLKKKIENINTSNIKIARFGLIQVKEFKHEQIVKMAPEIKKPARKKMNVDLTPATRSKPPVNL
jgi:hypothetical protein